MPTPTNNPAPVEANGDTDRAVAMAFLRDAKDGPCRPVKAVPGGEWVWCPDGEGTAFALIPKFSTDWDAAAQLSGYLRRAGWVTEMVLADACSVTLRRTDGATVRAEAPAFPLALCRAAMAVVEAEKARKT